MSMGEPRTIWSDDIKYVGTFQFENATVTTTGVDAAQDRELRERCVAIVMEHGPRSGVVTTKDQAVDFADALAAYIRDGKAIKQP